jgi:amidohydrolase
MTMSTIFPVSPTLISDITAIRRDLHRHPELGFQEYRTSKLVANYLQSLSNVVVHTGIGKTGVIGVLDTGKPGPCTALRADMDALAIEEVGSLEYRSNITGVMHACGHDGHTAALLGAAKILSENSESLTGKVVFIFQPAEEALGGARKICQDGILQAIGVQTIFGVHGWPGVKTSVVCIAEGPAMAASDGFSFTIQGKGVHASMPHLGRDPFYALGHIILALQSIPSRFINAQESVVISIGVINGGTAGNIIPESIQVRGTIRTLKTEIRKRVLQLVEETLAGLATTFGVAIVFECKDGYPPVVNSSDEISIVRKAASVVSLQQYYPFPPVMAGEDFSYYLETFPGVFWFIGLGEDSSQLHTPNFDFNDQVLEQIILMHCQIVNELILRFKSPKGQAHSSITTHS